MQCSPLPLHFVPLSLKHLLQRPNLVHPRCLQYRYFPSTSLYVIGIYDDLLRVKYAWVARGRARSPQSFLPKPHPHLLLQKRLWGQSHSGITILSTLEEMPEYNLPVWRRQDSSPNTILTCRHTSNLSWGNFFMFACPKFNNKEDLKLLITKATKRLTLLEMREV